MIKQIHLETFVKLHHLLRVLAFGDLDALLLFLGFSLHLFTNGNEVIDRGFKCSYEGLGIKRYRVGIDETVYVWMNGEKYGRPGSAFD